MIATSKLKGILLVLFVSICVVTTFAQQDPQYTHYMYNTMSVNSAYAGQRDVLSVTALHRSQWVGLEGSPRTQTLGIHSPLRNDRIGLGLSIVNDALGPANEIYVNTNFSYTILLNRYSELSFGLNAGLHNLSTDWSKGLFKNPDSAFNENLNLWAPIIGAGLYLHSDRWYVGLSVPNFITTKHYNDFVETVAKERLHYFLIAGLVFEINEDFKLKPAGLLKVVSGAPLIADLSINALIKEKLTLGLAWRWDDSVSALAGFQISNQIFVGYSYDATTTGLSNYNNGTHEIMLRFELEQVGRLLSPRFF